MAVKVIIPTPLRAYAEKQESVELHAGTVGEALNALTHASRISRSTLFRRWASAQLRERLRQRRRYPLPAEGSDALREGDTVSIVPSIAGGAQPVAFREFAMATKPDISTQPQFPRPPRRRLRFPRKKSCAIAAT